MIPVERSATPKYAASSTASTSTAFWIAWRTRMSPSAGLSTFMPSQT